MKKRLILSRRRKGNGFSMGLASRSNDFVDSTKLFPGVLSHEIPFSPDPFVHQKTSTVHGSDILGR